MQLFVGADDSVVNPTFVSGAYEFTSPNRGVARRYLCPVAKLVPDSPPFPHSRSVMASRLASGFERLASLVALGTNPTLSDLRETLAASVGKPCNGRPP